MMAENFAELPKPRVNHMYRARTYRGEVYMYKLQDGAFSFIGCKLGVVRQYLFQSEPA